MKSVTVIIVLSFLVCFGVTSVCPGVEPGEDAPALGPALTPASDPELTPEGTTAPAENKKKKSSSRRLKHISGQITAIDRGGKSISVGGLTIMANENMLVNLKEGDSVKVDYYSKGVHKAVFILREVK